MFHSTTEKTCLQYFLSCGFKQLVFIFHNFSVLIMKCYYRCNNNYPSSSSGHLGRGYCFFISWQDAQELTFWLLGFWMYKHIGLILYHWQSTGLAAMCWTFCSRLFAKYFMQNSGLSETGFIAFSQSRIISCCELWMQTEELVCIYGRENKPKQACLCSTGCFSLSFL